MSKAEDRALEAYPPKYAKQERHPQRVQSEKVDTHQPMRTIYVEGYHQAEKDLALTWEDINKIEIIIKDVYRDYPHGIEVKQFGMEVLNRFNKLKGK